MTYAWGQAAAAASRRRRRGAADEVCDPIRVRYEVALQRLLRTPAPDAATLARELELAADERAGEFFGDEAAMRAIERDAPRRRLGRRQARRRPLPTPVIPAQAGASGRPAPSPPPRDSGFRRDDGNRRHRADSA
ncbi:MAG TPA: hypothetical protein VF548_13495 [Allosphingosinicella sp.]